MTDKRLDKLVELRKLRSQLRDILDSMDKDYWVKVATGNGKELSVSISMRDEFRQFVQKQYDRVCKEFEEA